jgi:transcriptional regulator with XRE-family HTH domain
MKNRLRILRAECNLAQYQLASLAGVEATRYWRIEHNLVKPNADERARIATALGVSQRRIWPTGSRSERTSAVAGCEQVAPA